MSSRGGKDYRRDEDEEEEEEEATERDYKSQKDAVLFVIDVSASMLKQPPASDSKKADKDSPLAASLKCAYQIMQQRILAQPKDMMGILFFGTEKSKFRDEGEDGDSTSYPHCYLFMDLDVPSAEDVRTLRRLVEDGEDPDEILVPSSKPVAMANALFCANQILTTNAPNFGSRRLFIITDNDDPHAGDKAAKTSAAVRAKDLYDLGVTIELFPLGRGQDKFDVGRFYNDIVYRDPVAEEGSAGEVKSSKSGDGITLLASLISNVNSKQTPKRSYFSSLPFEIAPGLVITVKGYIMTHRQKPARTCYIWLGGEKPQIATGEGQKTEEGTHREVEAKEIKKAYKFGGEYVYFSPEEHKLLKEWKMGPERSSDDKGLRIIGFKPRSMLPLWASVKKALYIFPSEEDYVGSTRVFSALWQKLLKDKKMAVAWFIARKNANPLLVAILPSQTQSEESGTSYLPAGLWLYPLPFADDLREIDRKRTQKCSDQLIDQMRPIVENLQLPKGTFNPAKYPNPSLQWHYKILQALALEEEVPETGDDATVPKYKAINNRVGGYLVEFKEAVEGEALTLQKTRAIKREAEADTDDRPKKRAKAAPATKSTGDGLSIAQLKAAVDKGTLGKKTVAELKDILASKGVSTSGKKGDLVERLEQWVEANS